jgi:predicted nucleic acid-binding protein
MNIVDSSLWLEYFAGNTKGQPVSEVIKDSRPLLVPVICLYEVYKKLLLERNEAEALIAIAHMRLGKVIELDDELALSAANYSKELKLPMADSIIYASARKYNAVIWTQDQHFKDMEYVEYVKKA